MHVKCASMKIIGLLSLALMGFALHATNFSIYEGPYGSGRIFVPCGFDGMTTDCFLDTGSDRSNVLNVGKISSYPSLGPAQQHGASGRALNCEWVFIREFHAGDFLLRNHQVSRCPGVIPGSVLGIDIVFGKRFGLNFENRDLTLDDHPIPQELTKEQFTYAPAGLIVLPVEVSGEAMTAVWDTGAGLTAVERTFAESHPALFKKIGHIENGVDVAGHPVEMTLYSLREIKIGDKTFSNVTVVAIDFISIEAGIGSEAKIVLGYNLIRLVNWYVDTRVRSWAIY